MTVKEMSRGDFDRLFMLAASSQRPDEAANAERVPTGEKGIGRFAASRLGDRLRVLTRADVRLAEALEVTFDWRKFRDKNKQFEQIRIPYEMAETRSYRDAKPYNPRNHWPGDTWERSKIEGPSVSVG